MNRKQKSLINTQPHQLKLFYSFILLSFFIGGAIPFLPENYFFIIIFSIIIIFFVIFFQKPKLNLVILIFSVLLGKITTIQFNGKTPDIFWFDLIFILSFISLIVYKIIAEEKFHISYLELLMGGFIIVASSSYFVAIDNFRFIAWLKIITIPILIFFLAKNTKLSNFEIDRYFLYLIVLGTIISLISIFQSITSIQLFNSVIKTSFRTNWGNSNYLASFFILLIPIAISIGFTKQKIFTRIIGFICSIIMIIGLLLSSSRGGVIGLLAGIIFGLIITLLKKQTKIKQVIIFCLVLAIILFFSWNIIPIDFKQFWIRKLLNEFIDSGNLVRIFVWKFAFTTFLKNPIFGIGFSNQVFYQEEITNFSYGSHNIYLLTLLEMGLLGGIFLGLILFYFWSNITKLLKITKNQNRNKLMLGVFIGFLGILINAFYEPSFWGAQFSAIFWLIMGLCNNLLLNIKNQKFL